MKAVADQKYQCSLVAEVGACLVGGVFDQDVTDHSYPCMAGSVRRGERHVHDLDLVLTPKLELREDTDRQDLFHQSTKKLAWPSWERLFDLAKARVPISDFLGAPPVTKDVVADLVLRELVVGSIADQEKPWNECKIVGFRLKSIGQSGKVLDGLSVECYLTTDETWPLIRLVRTGSKGHNIKLAMRAKSLGMKFRADGLGLEREDGSVVRVTSEEHLFQELQLSYVEPSKRT